jgi:hypothetical protein
MNRLIRRSAGPGVDVFFDPLSLLCQGSDCLFKRGSSYLFQDFGHFSRFGSQIIVSALLRATHPIKDPVLPSTAGAGGFEMVGQAQRQGQGCECRVGDATRGKHRGAGDI